MKKSQSLWARKKFPRNRYVYIRAVGIQGAVYGAAGGFITGGLISVGSQLLRTCLR